MSPCTRIPAGCRKPGSCRACSRRPSTSSIVPPARPAGGAGPRGPGQARSGAAGPPRTLAGHAPCRRPADGEAAPRRSAEGFAAGELGGLVGLLLRLLAQLPLDLGAAALVALLGLPGRDRRGLLELRPGLGLGL